MSRVICGDSLNCLRMLEPDSVDSCVTDPPYELGFMGKKWDSTGIAYNVALWREVFRVLKPGAFLLSFGGSRTYHRMACAIEDAGFEVRDQIMWIYGSGFPKSLDISKAIDKAAGAVRDREPCGTLGSLRSFADDQWTQENGGQWVVDTPITELAAQWEGWGTALKPAHEPICVARKPFPGSVVANVLKHGTAGLNIDACRIGDEIRTASFTSLAPCHGNRLGEAGTAAARRGTQGDPKEYEGRFPSNVILDEVAVIILDEQSGILTSGKPCGTKTGNNNNVFGRFAGGIPVTGIGDSGGASRFFYCPKTSQEERGDGNIHPTVKPLELMHYLLRLVTKRGGIVLDPFAGSGSTGLAAIGEGLEYVLVDKDPSHIPIIRTRLGLMCPEIEFESLSPIE